MGTLSKSIKKIKSMEEKLFAMRLHLNLLRVKLKKPKYFVGVDYAKDISCSEYMDLKTYCYICEEVIPKICPKCGKKVTGTKNIIYGMSKVVDWHCLNCYHQKLKQEERENKLTNLVKKIKDIWVLDFIKHDKKHPTNPTFETEKYYDEIDKIIWRNI